MKTIQQLDEYTRHWFDIALQWADKRWSEKYQLLQMPLDRKYSGKHEAPYIIRDSVWYAVGLLMRQQSDDIERAVATIEAVLSYQFDEPSAVYHGTFYRHISEAHPPPDNAVIWRHYDPNWREFICTVFILLLKDYSRLLPDILQARMRHAINLAATGAFERKVEAAYTNIALMSAFLLDYAGREFGNIEWCDYALTQAQEIHRLFRRFNTFSEYNSPTYYGVDFFALALWREYGSTPIIREMGASMEAELWRDLVQFYHADMRNICGPYDRSYGMNMTDYLALLGLWIGSVLPATHAPIPNVSQHFEHAADFFFMPLVALVGSRPPDDAILHLKEFQGERVLERTIEQNRIVTAWLSASIMIGAESDLLNSTRTEQFHPATVHWITTDGSIGWLRTRCRGLIQALTQPYQLQLSSQSTTTYVFEIYASEISTNQIQANHWHLPGISIHLKRPNTPLTVTLDDGALRVQFESSEPITLIFSVATEAT